MGKEKRVHLRTRLPAKVKVMHPDIGEVVLEVRDLSDGGLYVYCDDPELLPVGSEVRVQALNEEMEMPVIEVEIVRKDSEGMGMKIIS